MKKPTVGGWRACPQCKSTEVEQKEDTANMVMLIMCIKCNKSWTVPTSTIAFDKPFSHTS